MSQKFIDIFKVSCVKLAHTVVINHPYAGIVINKRLEQEGFGRYTNTQDRNTWKYYLNMAGIYHLYDSAKIHKINRERKIGWSWKDTIPEIDRVSTNIGNLSFGQWSNKMIIRVAGNEGTVEKEFTLENISGSSSDENLSLNYQSGTSAYNELLDIYPEFEALIKGILHPIPLIVSTNAEDFSVLYCGGYYRTRLNTLQSEYAFIKGSALIYDFIDLVEDWEYSLIDKIEEFTKIYFKQHDSRVYAEYNDLYIAASIGIYYLNLPTTIFNIRLEKVKTMETHSTHVQLYLDSYINLGQYMGYLTRAQCMYLYRNIEWLTCNSGKQKVFDDLVENFLKDRGIAVIVYDGYHDTDKLGLEDEPRPIFIRDYNDGTKLINTKKRYTPEEIIELEKSVARDNDKYVEDQISRVTDSTLNSTSSKFKTKIIETHLSTQTLNQYVSREEFLFNNWVWSAITKEYTGIISVNLPHTGDKLQLTIKNALLLFYYCYAKGFLNIQPTEIPELLLHHIPKTHLKVYTRDEMRIKWELENPTLVEQGETAPEAYLASWKDFHDVSDEYNIRQILGYVSSSQHYITDEELNSLFTAKLEKRRYASTGQFGREMEKMWNSFIARNYIAHSNPFIRASAEIKGVVERLYHVKKLKINLDQNYDTWVASLGGNVQTMNQQSLQLLANSLFITALNIEDEDEETLTKIHKALINIVKTFASYNIQFITKTASGEVSNLGVNYPRVEHVLTRYFDDNDYHIYNYPDYQSVVQSSNQETIRWGFGIVYDSFDSRTNLLSQEQLRGLILTEQNNGIIVGDT